MASILTCISSMATRMVLSDLIRAYEKRTGYRVATESVGGMDAARRVRTGEPFDVVVLAATVMAQLEAEGRIIPGSRAGVARSGMAIAVRANAPRPAIDDAAAVRQAILSARAVCYSTGPSGDHLKQLWNKWAIADVVSPRAVQAPPGVPVAAMLARGEADLGFQQLSELLDAPGIDILGPLPSEIQAITVFSAGVAKISPSADEALAFVSYLASPDTDTIKRFRGMEPVDRETSTHTRQGADPRSDGDTAPAPP